MAISRRVVLGGAGASLGGVLGAQLAAGSTAWAAGRAAAAAKAAGTGREIDLCRGWRFALVNTTGEEAPQPAAGDPAWRDVDVPHDWSVGLDPVKDDRTTAGSGYLPGGLGWYTKTFTLPAETARKRISVEFDGVYMDAQVHFNGELVATHPYGYTGFAVDLTDLAHTDGRTANTLSVRARNQVPSSRWYSGSGIHRDVRLVVTDPVHLVRHGITVTTPDLERTVGKGHAAVRVAVAAVSEEQRSVRAEVTATVRDADGRQVASVSAPATLTGDPTTTTLDLRIDKPRLWSVKRPYLYTVVTRVTVSGRIVDETSTPFGLRWTTFDPGHGFSLNGERMKLQGVNLHHDLGALGAAFHPDAARRQLEIMREMGVNALRTSHNPPAPQLVTLCAELGIMLQVEAFDCWRTPKNPYDYGRFFDEHSDADIKEMVHAAKNSPAVIMWSIGNEIPDSTAEAGVAMAERLIAAVKSVDATRPVVIGSDKYRSVPKDGSPQDRILRMLDGVGLNYNTAASVDALHKKYPDTFFFESESSSSTSTRGVYESPDQLNTGENYTPGKRGSSSYDNNLESWTMSGEYALKKDRDREFFGGQFVWTGIDYIGEPTPYDDVFPVKSSFFGAVDTAGFPKDQFSLFRSQWSETPMVHLVPMDWTGHRPKDTVTVWAYSNADSVELFLNGRSLGVRRFDRKKTADGREYLETTEATGDDKTVTSGPYPGSYTSPNGSAGRLHLTWQVPFEAGKLVAVARRNGREVARDTLRTAGEATAVRLTPDRKQVAGDGLVFVTAEVTDSRGVLVPDAGHALTFQVTGGHLLGADNGQQESAENYQSPVRSAFHGKALAIVRPAAGAGAVTVTARAKGLHSASVRVAVTGHRQGASASATAPAAAAATGVREAASGGPTADASFSGAPDTVPAAMLDGDAATGWSNHYRMAATALLPAISRARARDWVSVTWPRRRDVSGLDVSLTTDDDTYALPEAIAVSYWDGREYVPADHVRIEWADASDSPTRVTFDTVRTSRVRLELTSRHPDAANGFFRIVRLAAAE
ncbi:glycoside hydrolase family 2 TIM barrel-domain containing protein [Streptomyces ochraceiscleroticus]|uniref:Glycoside hydrolase family 2 TIM barrel-domain containing protein n=1 Tax=Streptomyces ochraceiscleroticus TaxID=47761 RepID=A0ABW1MJC4_9ACTN|nr:glycoside hydrolase family 2 TIM barrel-domain containing protein [Streptomyces ochraceiscleroticus]